MLSWNNTAMRLLETYRGVDPLADEIRKAGSQEFRVGVKLRFFNASLDAAIKAKGWTRTEATTQLEVSHNTLSRLLAFKTYPNWIKRGGGKFCSCVCASQFHRNRVEKECEQCGSKFSVKPCALIHNASRFCSSKCSQIASLGRDHFYCT